MSIIKILNESEVLPVDLDDVKTFLKLDYQDDTDEDNVVKRALKTAIKQCENIINKTILEKKYKYCIYDLLKNSILKLPYGDVKEISSVKIINKNNESVAINNNNYFLDSENDCIVFKVLPTNYYRMEIEYTAKLDSIPNDILQGILFHTAKIYEDKTGYSQLPKASSMIYKKYKQFKQKNRITAIRKH